MLPAGFRQRDQTKKSPTGPFDRDALQQHLEKQALEHEDRDDLVPFTGEKKGGRAGAHEILHSIYSVRDVRTCVFTSHDLMLERGGGLDQLHIVKHQQSSHNITITQDIKREYNSA